MSYDVLLRVSAKLRRHAGGDNLDPRARLARARAILQAFEPQIQFDTDAGACVAQSEVLGEVEVGADGIWLSMSLGSDPRSVYSAIHGLLQRFHTEPYEAFDPQIGGCVVYRADFAEFMRQYRAQFTCSDVAFERWCAGGDVDHSEVESDSPQAPAVRAAQAFPRYEHDLSWEERRALSDTELWAYVQALSARNDAAICQHGLLDYMDMLSEEARSDLASCRLDGRHYPGAFQPPWFQSSALHYEAIVLGELRQRGFQPAVQQRPQRLAVEFDLAEGEPISNAHRDAVIDTMRPIIQALKTSGQVTSHEFSGRGNCWRYEFYGDDVDAIEAAFRAHLSAAAMPLLSRILKRHGAYGAPEVTAVLAPPV